MHDRCLGFHSLSGYRSGVRGEVDYGEVILAGLAHRDESIRLHCAHPELDILERHIHRRARKLLVNTYDTIFHRVSFMIKITQKLTFSTSVNLTGTCGLLLLELDGLDALI